MRATNAWYPLNDVEGVASPALLVYPDRVRENVRRMIALAGDVDRLRPHVKTHKMAEVVRIQMEEGVRKFKCATLAEAEMTASCGARDVLLAFPVVGPNVRQLVGLARCFPQTKFSVIGDDGHALRELSTAWSAGDGLPGPLEVLIDLDVGMHRTGILPGAEAIGLYRRIHQWPGLRAGGLHVYDGHLRDRDAGVRAARCSDAFAPVTAMADALKGEGLPVPRIVAGGTPTFPMYAARGDVECSPGTCVLWDAGYGAGLPDLDFLPAAVLLTRVVSRPTASRWCLDLGVKAVASEMPPPRVEFLNLTGVQAVMHSEEHLVVEAPEARDLGVGAAVYAVPWHVCPTVALHAEVTVVVEGDVLGAWTVTARDRQVAMRLIQVQHQGN